MCEPISIGATMAAVGSSIASATAAVSTAAAATGGAIAAGAGAVGTGLAATAGAVGSALGIGGAAAGTGAAAGGAAAGAGMGAAGATAALNTAAAATWGSGLAAAGIAPVGASAGMASAASTGLTATLGTLGNIASAGAALYGGVEAKMQHDYAKGEAKDNAKIAKIQAGHEETRGQLERQDIRLNAAQVEGAGKAAYGASGVQLGTGSTLSWAMDTAERAAYDIGISEENTLNRMWGLDVQRQNFLSQSKMYGRAGRNALIGGVLNSGATFAANKFPSTWSRGYGNGYGW